MIPILVFQFSRKDNLDWHYCVTANCTRIDRTFVAYLFLVTLHGVTPETSHFGLPEILFRIPGVREPPVGNRQIKILMFQQGYIESFNTDILLVELNKKHQSDFLKTLDWVSDSLKPEPSVLCSFALQLASINDIQVLYLSQPCY